MSCNKFTYSEKQISFIKSVINKDLGFVNILDGSVRSGKTFITNLAWCIFVLESEHDVFLMSGESTDSLYRNVISDILFILGNDKAKYMDSAKGGAQLVITHNDKTKICYCRGGSKANDEGKIRGITIAGWLADEITLHHSSFINQAMSRMSLKGAKAIWTTNPDSPYHLVKTDFIDKVGEKNYKHWHFELDDNLSLDSEYKENIKKAYTGLFYDRFIRGLWVLAEGVIYDVFDKDKHIVKTMDRNYVKKYVSCDYGTNNPTTFGLFSLEAGTNQWYKEKEYHYSGRESKLQKTDEQYCDDLEKFIDGNKTIQIIVDPSALSFITALKKRGFKVIPARNNVLEGIRKTLGVIKDKEILFNDCNKETFKEFDTYMWDEKASLKGEDKPIKENDHHMDNLRYFVNTVLKKKAGGMQIFK